MWLLVQRSLHVHVYVHLPTNTFKDKHCSFRCTHTNTPRNAYVDVYAAELQRYYLFYVDRRSWKRRRLCDTIAAEVAHTLPPFIAAVIFLDGRPHLRNVASLGRQLSESREESRRRRMLVLNNRGRILLIRYRKDLSRLGRGQRTCAESSPARYSVNYRPFVESHRAKPSPGGGRGGRKFKKRRRK